LFVGMAHGRVFNKLCLVAVLWRTGVVGAALTGARAPVSPSAAVSAPAVGHAPPAVAPVLKRRRRRKGVEHLVVEATERSRAEATASPGVRMAAFAATVLSKLPPAATIAAAAMLFLDEAALPLYLTLPVTLEAAHYLVSKTSSRAFVGKTSPHESLPERDDEAQVELWRQCLDDPTVSVEELLLGWFFREDEVGPLPSHAHTPSPPVDP
jgi:hypothetical protein